MKRSASAPQTILPARFHTRLALYLTIVAGAVIAIMPLHGFLTVWGAQLGLDYTLLRLWKEFVLLVLAGGCLVLAIDWYMRQRNGRTRRVRDLLRADKLITLMLAYLSLILLVGIIDLATGRTSVQASAFGIILDARFILFFLIVLFLTKHTDWIVRHWRELLLIPASVVVVFGILQFFVLPPDFLAHFGYGPETIPAVQTIDQKVDYQRIQSTLRGANPLGTYLILILVAIGGLVAQARGTGKNAGKDASKNWRRFYVALFALSLAALVLTFSRSAWIGMVIAAFMLAWMVLPTESARQKLALGTVILVVIFGGLTYLLRKNDTFQNAIFHTDEHSTSSESSNQGHFAATTAGVRDMLSNPLGTGLGSAGPASVYNDPRPAKIAENYFVQVGQELGLAGLALFIAINVYIIRAFWTRKRQLLPCILLASFIGITAVNMFMHAWTDDTVSYIWWGLAGAALATSLTGSAKKVGSAAKPAAKKSRKTTKRAGRA